MTKVVVTPIPSLKQSKVHTICLIPSIIETKLRTLKDCMTSVFFLNVYTCFENSMQMSSDLLLSSIIDRSLTNRTEFSINIDCNKKMAYVGDAYLSFFISYKCMEDNMSQSQYQQKRSELTCKSKLSQIYNTYFSDCLLTWEIVLNPELTPSTKQKCEFVEAIIGHMAMYNNKQVDDFLITLFEF